MRAATSRLHCVLGECQREEIYYPSLFQASLMARRRRGHDDRERRTWQDPAVILSPIGLKEGMVFVDVGCGEGFFSIPAARMVGKTGKVIGIDADEQAITYLIRQAEYLDLPNLTAWRGRAKEKVAVVNGADVVFFGICLHDF